MERKKRILFYLMRFLYFILIATIDVMSPIFFSVYLYVYFAMELNEMYEIQSKIYFTKYFVLFTPTLCFIGLHTQNFLEVTLGLVFRDDS